MNGCEFIRIVTKNDEECFLLTKLRNGGKEGFELTVCHDGHAWTGEVSEDDLDSLSSKLKMNFDKYVKQTVEALTSSESRDTFQYTLKRLVNKADFVWKKHVPAEDITFQLGSVTLHARTDATQFITLMFQHCLQSMQELKERIHSLETDNERLSLERINALKRLEKCVVAKEELEHEMYSKFSMVLNSKKEKIRQLKKQVEEGGSGDNAGDASDEPQTSTSNMKRSKPDQNRMQQTTGDSDVDTDEETPKSKRQRSSQPQKPGPSKQTTLSPADESLDLGHDDEETSVVSRPKRQRGHPQKKQTPSKPVLPRVGSNESNPGSERKPRMRKSGSSNSNRSSDNIDADDLMDQL